MIKVVLIASIAQFVIRQFCTIGFIFSIAPGGIGFENAPFKLTKEYIELIGGKDSDLYTYYYYQLVNSFI